MGFGLRTEIGAERTTTIVRNTGIRLKVDDEQMADHTRK